MEEKLKEAILKMVEIAKEYDVLASIVLADGLGHGEFYLNFDEPTWSQFEIKDIDENGKELTFKIRGKTDEELIKTEKTGNAVFVLTDIMVHQTKQLINVTKSIREDQNIVVEEDTNPQFYNANGIECDAEGRN